MKIILFIGHHKVGSSALQGYMARNAVALLQQGVLYPAVEDLGLTRLMAEAASKPELLPPNVREAHNALAFSMIHDHNGSPVPDLHPDLPSTDEMLAIIQRQIVMFQPKVVVLAAEVFSHFGHIHGGLITRLTEALTAADPAAEVQLTATLRRVDDYLISWHGQRLRFGQQVRPLPQGALNHYFKTIHFDYRKMLEGWIKALPEAPLNLRTYDAVMAAGGSVPDFMAQARLPLPFAHASPDATLRRVNEGLHRALIEIVRQANAGLEPEDAADLFRILLQIGPQMELPPSAEIELYGVEARARLDQRFSPIHDWLSDQAGQPFFASLDQLRVLRPHPEHEANRAALAQLTGPYADEFTPMVRDFLSGLVLSPNYA